MWLDLDKLFYKARVGLSSETEVKYKQLSAAAENASEAAKSCERLDKLKAKAKKDSLTAKICTSFSNDLEDLLS